MQTWGIHPGKLLMVGDSHEDVECGNAAGTATCLIAGGGNEVGESCLSTAGMACTTHGYECLFLAMHHGSLISALGTKFGPESIQLCWQQAPHL